MARPRVRRLLIDGTMAKGGGGFTYLVNIVPQLAALAPGDRIRLLLRSERLAQSIPLRANVEIDVLPDASWRQRLAFTYHALPRLAREWQADVIFSAAESAPLRAHCPMIASFRNANLFLPMDQEWCWKERQRLRALRGGAPLVAHLRPHLVRE
jgi:hypothetical protein